MPETETSYVELDGETHRSDEVEFNYEGESGLLEELDFEIRNHSRLHELDLSETDYEDIEEWLSSKIVDYREGNKYSASNKAVLFVYGLQDSFGTSHVVIESLEDVEEKLTPVSES